MLPRNHLHELGQQSSGRRRLGKLEEYAEHGIGAAGRREHKVHLEGIGVAVDGVLARIVKVELLQYILLARRAKAQRGLRIDVIAQLNLDRVSRVDELVSVLDESEE